ncbi:MAG: hypothetical protein K5872_09495 [Rhizobiaceae bacterium]|nr:hypothetical protein [Rhizobiaceae bacterium]MCV0406448.1 hypothetical protein [Rhizobiaceae bacterium]
MSEDLDWIVIRDFTNREIGAIGFVGHKAAVVVSFYDDLDGNKDGKVSWGEWGAGKLSPISLDNKAVTEVAMAARTNLEVLERDASFGQMAMQLFTQFARGLMADGIYAVYFSRGVSSVAKPIAGRLTKDMVKQFVVRKGMEKAVKGAYDTAMK